MYIPKLARANCERSAFELSAVSFLWILIFLRPYFAYNPSICGREERREEKRREKERENSRRLPLFCISISWSKEYIFKSAPNETFGSLFERKNIFSINTLLLYIFITLYAI